MQSMASLASLPSGARGKPCVCIVAQAFIAQAIEFVSLSLLLSLDRCNCYRGRLINLKERNLEISRLRGGHFSFIAHILFVLHNLFLRHSCIGCRKLGTIVQAVICDNFHGANIPRFLLYFFFPSLLPSFFRFHVQ